MRAILYRSDGETRLTLGGDDPDDVEGEVVESKPLAVDAEDAFALLTEHPVDDSAVPTIEAVTQAYDPWVAWFGGTSEDVFAVLYGRKNDHDRRVRFRETGDGYEVTLEYGSVVDVTDHEFDPTDHQPVVVTTDSKLHAKRTFLDLCDVT